MKIPSNSFTYQRTGPYESNEITIGDGQGDNVTWWYRQGFLSSLCPALQQDEQVAMIMLESQHFIDESILL